MRYRNIIIALGFLILILSTGIIGVPVVWREVALRLATFAVVVLAYLAGNERKVATVAAVTPAAPTNDASNASTGSSL